MVGMKIIIITAILVKNLGGLKGVITDMNSKQFAWLYLVENGVSGLTRSYYGGFESSKDPEIHTLDQYKFDFMDKVKEINFKKIKRAGGVNWDRTQAPDSGWRSEFQGTFADSLRVETLEGTLVLKNGQTMEWEGDNIEVRNVFDMMAEVDAAKERFAEIFGED